MKDIKDNPLSFAAKDAKKIQHQRQAEAFFRQAQTVIVTQQDWQACGSLILKGLAEERKAMNSGVQVLNVIRQRPKTRLEFSFRS
ncbi:hypothetical protein [Synechococcus sp. A15-28]|uniref:hypothetical protein n=1 Tax=Synechococcus sp. A15-28 TaxID=1050638 RepID=UPI0016476717|nr:hypothetical protein [Synechococcus sp. A15-28]